MSDSATDSLAARRWFLAIVNPISGRRDVTRAVESIAKCLSEQGAELAIKTTRARRQATDLTRAAPPETDAILVIGGDGTVNEVLEGLDAQPVPLAILPTGTENLLAKYLRMPRKPAEMADLLLHGEVHPQDLGRVNGRGFHSVIGAGFDAECVARLAACRRGHISYWTYVMPILRTIREHRFPRLRVDLDQMTIFEGRGLAIAGLIPRYAAGLRVLKFADPTDGLLDVVIFECITRTRLIRHAVNVAFRRHLPRRTPHERAPVSGVTFGQGRRISITSPDAVPVEIDGDPAGTLPVDLVIQRAAARFLRPANGVAIPQSE